MARVLAPGFGQRKQGHFCTKKGGPAGTAFLYSENCQTD